MATKREPATPIMTVQQVAGLLQVNKSTIYRMANRGELPAFRLGGDWRFDRKRIEWWCRTQTRKEQHEADR